MASRQKEVDYVSGYLFRKEVLDRFLKEGGVASRLLGPNVVVNWNPPTQPPTEPDANGDVDEQLALSRRIFYRCHSKSPPELKKRLQLISEYTPIGPDGKVIDWWLFIQTPCFSDLKTRAPEDMIPDCLDLWTIDTFIRTANQMIVDDSTRERVGFKRENMKFTVVPANENEILHTFTAVRETANEQLALQLQLVKEADELQRELKRIVEEEGLVSSQA